MENPTILEACYRRYMNNLTKWLPDGVIDVNLETLQKLNLLNFHNKTEDYALNRYFQVVESDEKLTLVNEDFIVWIVPVKSKKIPSTYTLIALNKENDVRLELAFSTSGVYNHSHLVLRLLEKYLLEIQNTEEQLAKLEKQTS
jgi:hypothetical protein